MKGNAHLEGLDISLDSSENSIDRYVKKLAADRRARERKRAESKHITLRDLYNELSGKADQKSNVSSH